MEKIEYKKEIERLKEEQRKAICEDWEKLKGTAAPYNIFFKIAVDYGLTAQGVAWIVSQAGLYTGK